MPELPEVETTCNGISPFLTAQTIKDVVVRVNKLRWEIPTDIHKHLSNQQIIKVSRRAKYIIIELLKGHIIMHLGMSGHLRVLREKLPAGKHDHIDLILANGNILRYNDPRRFGAFVYTEESIDQFRLLEKLGPEPISAQFDSNYLLASCKNKRLPIKTHIMNQATVVGVGNIYASEALFTAKINPLRAACSINDTECSDITQAIKDILTAAIEQGGTSFSDYINSDGKPGYFSQQLQVYQRAGLPCKKCNTVIENIRIGQRSSFYCPGCQK